MSADLIAKWEERVDRYGDHATHARSYETFMSMEKKAQLVEEFLDDLREYTAVAQWLIAEKDWTIGTLCAPGHTVTVTDVPPDGRWVAERGEDRCWRTVWRAS